MPRLAEDYIKTVLSVFCPDCRRHIGLFNISQPVEAQQAARDHVCDPESWSQPITQS